MSILISNKIDLKIHTECFKRERRTPYNDQGINPRKENNCKYTCTQYRNSSIYKAGIRQNLIKQMGEKIIYKDTKKVEAFQNFHIVSGIRTWSISTWIKSIIFLTVFPNRQQSRYKLLTSLLYAFCPNVTEHPGPLQEGLEAFMSLCKLFPSGLSSVPSPNQDWNPSFFLF